MKKTRKMLLSGAVLTVAFMVQTPLLWSQEPKLDQAVGAPVLKQESTPASFFTESNTAPKKADSEQNFQKQLMEGDSVARSSALKALKKQNPAQALPILRAFFPKANEGEKAEVVAQLLEKGEKDLSSAVHGFAKNPSANARMKVAYACRYAQQDPLLAQEMLNWVKTDSSPLVREYAALSLKSVGSFELYKDLESVIGAGSTLGEHEVNAVLGTLAKWQQDQPVPAPQTESSTPATTAPAGE